MEIEQLIEQITSLVMERLSGGEMPDGAGAGPAVPAAPATSRVFLLCTEQGRHIEACWEALRACARLPVEWSVLCSDELTPSMVRKELPALRMQVFEALPSSWRALISAMDLVVVPVMTLTLASKTANLIADDPQSRVIIQALIENRRVLAGMEELTFLTRHSAQLPKPLVSVLNARIEAVKSMGIREVQIHSLEQEMARSLGGSLPAGRGNNVITKSDIEAALAEGKKSLEFLRGTIVTPLAREYAEKMNVKIVTL